VVDLHIHYPMHLLARAPRDVVRGMSRVSGRPRWVERLRAVVLLVAARVLNFRSWNGDWRVSLDGLERGDVEVACSALYQPFDEIDLDEPYAATPEAGYFADLERQIRDVEADLRALDPDGTRHVIVRTASDLDRALEHRAIGVVHCVEGGFHLGATAEQVRTNVAVLAGRGVRYVTLAHLFYRRVATNAPAIPFLPDAVYARVFPQPGRPGLTDLGAAAVEAMYEHGVIVDISHMTQASIDDTFAMLDRLVAEHDADPHS
jgi:microsomal dipeptidase-like Zn-dependent dipeptidase